MLQVVIGCLAIAAGVVFLFRPAAPQPSGGAANPLARLAGLLSGMLGSLALVAVGLFLLASTSFIFVGATQVGHLKRIYATAELPSGRIIALGGEKGPQARILGPGFHFIPLLNVLYDVEEFPVVEVPEGYYGQLITRDGQPMPAGMFIAPVIPDERLKDMLDAETFLAGSGYRGPQETVLKPGAYRINRYLFEVKVDDETKATIIPAGHVGVVKSNVYEPTAHCVEEQVSAAQAAALEGALSVPLVARGCLGIWKEALLPGAYYLNRHAYEVTLVDTRVRAWEYKGGYTRRNVDLSLDQQGNIKQIERATPQPVPQGAADQAVFVRMEGWDIPLELRALVQVAPENAPIVVGAVGGVEEVEDRILTPVIRSIVRNVAGSNIRVPQKEAGRIVGYSERPARVMDLIENREYFESTIEEQVKIEGRKAGVEVREIRLGEPSIPPELLIPRLRVQLADQLGLAYDRETAAQKKRIETEQARSTANEQPRLVESQIAVLVAGQREEERAALGRAERKFLEEIARGQRAQSEVLGQDRVALLQALEKTLGSMERKPELVQIIGRLVPHTVVNSGGSSLEGAAAILSNALGGVGAAPAPAAPPPGAAPVPGTPSGRGAQR